MREKAKKSLLLRIGLAMATITLLAFVGMLSSVIIADTTEGEAAAINQAGTLRMQSYRIASSLTLSSQSRIDGSAGHTLDLISGFEQRLNSPRLTGILRSESDNTITNTYRLVEQQWHQRIKPMLLGRIQYGSKALTPTTLATIDLFVEKIDKLVGLLEEATESRIQFLRLIQVVSLFLTLMVAFYTMYLMNTDVLNPLRALLNFTQHVGQRDFTIRVRHNSGDELGQLGEAFNVMAEDLSQQYDDLESLVQTKTADLERTNRSLELLYNTTRTINTSTPTDRGVAILRKLVLASAQASGKY
ncbi:type IV pili methyl-accepting chemotaxis transducer N-terminal domain-containing protein [Candidatus Reidiella endopervernicosa]|uniref:histidine kinase n=1 Tax=Candidatus Reidiella endopervernicosa TaxID=2738883 RepID=A0A6N0HVI3_9GAMM|nr:type IV pili methyl-accepting chemotaxis transducer N-terminal domain-containing protein [Candidatus Reidiella endopervernicosa]QKQ26394.1 type IV pili methyl-accepting chemotaxis transducer N-terminal domain-containing protein [Candidatus Reidiella endopervernicosa]